MGATALKDSFRFEELLMLKDQAQDMPGEDEKEAEGPIYLVLLGTWWFTRGIELSAAKRRDVRLDKDKQEVSWNLPASKRDPKALGEERTHGCLCGELKEDVLCPFHKMEEWLDNLNSLYPYKGGDAEVDDLPLFPDRAGAHMSKEATIRAGGR